MLVHEGLEKNNTSGCIWVVKSLRGRHKSLEPTGEVFAAKAHMLVTCGYYVAICFVHNAATQCIYTFDVDKVANTFLTIKTALRHA